MKSSTSTLVVHALVPTTPMAASSGESLLWIAGPTELQVHAKTINMAPNPVFHPIVSPSSTAANAVPQIGSVAKIIVDSAAETFSMATVSANTVSEVATSPVQRSAKGTASDPEDGRTVSLRLSKDTGSCPAWAHHPIARTATVSRCAATMPSVSPGYFRELRSVSQKTTLKLSSWREEKK